MKKMEVYKLNKRKSNKVFLYDTIIKGYGYPIGTLVDFTNKDIYEYVKQNPNRIGTKNKLNKLLTK